jgi:hypothetical protein
VQNEAAFNTERKSVSIHSQYYEAIIELTPEERSSLLLALVLWAQGQDMELDRLCFMLFRQITKTMLSISETYSRNGKLGGRPPTKRASLDMLANADESDHEGLDNYLDGNDSVASSNMTLIGEKGFVCLSQDEYRTLSAKHGKELLEKGIKEADAWAASKEKCNTSDWVSLVERAINQKWNNLSPKRGRKSNSVQSLLTTPVPTDEDYSDEKF